MSHGRAPNSSAIRFSKRGTEIGRHLRIVRSKSSHALPGREPPTHGGGRCAHGTRRMQRSCRSVTRCAADVRDQNDMVGAKRTLSAGGNHVHSAPTRGVVGETLDAQRTSIASRRRENHFVSAFSWRTEHGRVSAAPRAARLRAARRSSTRAPPSARRLGASHRAGAPRQEGVAGCSPPDVERARRAEALAHVQHGVETARCRRRHAECARRRGAITARASRFPPPRARRARWPRETEPRTTPSAGWPRARVGAPCSPPAAPRHWVVPRGGRRADPRRRRRRRRRRPRDRRRCAAFAALELLARDDRRNPPSSARRPPVGARTRTGSSASARARGVDDGDAARA